MVLLTVTVLIIVGMSLLSVSANGLRREGVQEKKVQAYYLAKSGANAMAGHIKKHYNYASFSPTGTVSLDDLNTQLNKDVALGAGSFKVQVSKVNNSMQTLKLVSTGNVNGVKDTATVLLTTSSFKFGQDTIFAEGTIEGNGSTSVTGSVATNLPQSDNPITVSVTGTKEYSANRDYPAAIYPTIASCNNNMKTETITADKCYKDTELKNQESHTLTVKISGNQDINVDLTALKAFKGQSALTINVVKDAGKTGKALIYFDSLDMNGGTDLSITGDANSAVVFFQGGLTAGGHTKFSKVSVYAPDSEISFAGGVTFNGVIIAKTVSLKGHSSADSLNYFEFTESITQIPAYQIGSWGSQ